MIAWAAETLIATTLLMVLVLLLRAPVRRAFGPQLAYALWLLPAARLLLPPMSGGWSLTGWLAPMSDEAGEAPGIAAGVLDADVISPQLADAAALNANFEVASHHAAIAVVPPTVVEHGLSLMAILIGAWGLGALVFLVFHLVAHSRFCTRMLKRARVDRVVADGRVRVIETEAAHGPLAFGIWRKYVAFPRDFSERYDEVERDLALAHELGHHARGDLVANWVALVVLAIHWFNPVAWRAFRAFRADQEMACDALVLAGRAQALRHAYGRAIVKSAHGGAVSAACHLHTINDLKGRLRMLSKTRNFSPVRLAAGALGVSVLTFAALGLTASGIQAAAPDVPAAPTAPAAPRAPAAVVAVVAPQDVPPPPVAPAVPAEPVVRVYKLPPAAPDAPDAPEGATRVVRVIQDGEPGKDGKRHRTFVVRSADGKEFDWESLRADMPQVREAKCGTDGDDKGHVIENKDGKTRIMIICTDRIEKMAANAAKMSEIHKELAEKHKAMGLKHALMGLRMARRSIENDATLSPSDRAEALKGIDEAIAKVERKRD